MATVAESSPVKRGANKAPVSTHPAFPAIVALWFAALLGLGSMVLPIALFESLSTVTGMAAILPAAEPPLGFTARAVIALASAIGGAAGGLLLARQVARSHVPKPKAGDFARGGAQEFRPISAHDELGDEGLDAADYGPAGQESSRSRYLKTVLLAGQMQKEEPEEDWPAAEAGRHSTANDTFDTSELTEDAAAALDRIEVPRPRAQPAEDCLSMQDQTMTERPSFGPFTSPPEAVEEEQAQPSSNPQASEYAPDPLVFSAPSRQREQAAEAEAHYAETPAPQLSVVDSHGPGTGFQRPIDDRPLEELGLVQLAARLGSAIERRRVLRANRSTAGEDAAPAEPALEALEDFEVAEAEEAARAITDFFGPTKAAATNPQMQPEAEAEPARPAVPESMRPLSIDELKDDEEDMLAAPFSPPFGGLDHSAIQSPDGEDDLDDEETDDDRDYSSLLTMKNPFTRQEEFVRVDEPEDDSGGFEPTVTFPSASSPMAAQGPAAAPARPALLDPPLSFDPMEEPADSAADTAAAMPPRDFGATDRDLRTALAALQRMSGGA